MALFGIPDSFKVAGFHIRDVQNSEATPTLDDVTYAIEMMSPSIHGALRFCGLFIVGIAAQITIHESSPMFFGVFHLLPVSWLATRILVLLGVQAELVTRHLAQGFCRLDLSGVHYAVTHECTGIIAVFILAAAVMAYPVALRERARGLLLAIPAVTLFGVLRLVILGIVAQARPLWIEVFHVYIMELVTIAFAMFVFIYWVEEAHGRDRH